MNANEDNSGRGPREGEGAKASGQKPLTTPGTAERVRESWQKLAGRERLVIDSFYDRLFALDPELQKLFAATDMEHLRTKFADTVRMLIAVIDDPDALYPHAVGSGKRHAVYGVRDRDYRTGGEALLWALSRHLGDDFTHEVRAAWAEAYTRLAFAMAKGARGD